VVALMQSDGMAPCPTRDPHAYLVMLGEEAQTNGFALAEAMREALMELRLTVDCAGGSLKAQMKRADRSGALVALILGEEEVRSGAVGIKHLRGSQPQERVHQTQLAEHLRSAVGFGAGA
jgi:histidyl-tRNA synthetase